MQYNDIYPNINSYYDISYCFVSQTPFEKKHLNLHIVVSIVTWEQVYRPD